MDLYQKLARLVASRLTKTELVELAEALDTDSRDEFCHQIQLETEKVAPELFRDDTPPKL